MAVLTTTTVSQLRHRFLVGVLTCCSVAGCAYAPAGSARADAPADNTTVLGALQRAQLDSTVAVALALANPLAARRAGFHRIAPPSVPDLSPLMGEHWINERNLGGESLDLTRPAYLMFYPLGNTPEQTLVGTAYGTVQLPEAQLPAGFAGNDDEWHIHLPCTGVPGVSTLLAEGVEDCRALGGEPGTNRIAMVHVWINIPNPLGPFALDNPALPYVAVGLTPPTADDMADLERAHWLRALGLALSETYGAVPRLSSRLDLHPDSTFAQTTAPLREQIRRLLPRMRLADRNGDAAEFERLGDRAIAEWQHIQEAYLNAALARSPELRSLFQRWFEAALDPMHGSKMD